MYLNLQTGSLGLGNPSLDECIRLARAYGYGGLDVPLGGVHTQDDAKVVHDKIAAASLRCSLFWLPCDISGADDAAFARSLDQIRTLAPLAAKVGLQRTSCYIWSWHDQRTYDENWAWHVNRLRALTSILRPHGIQLGIEFLGTYHLRAGHKYEFVHTLDETIKLIAEAPGTGVIFDTFHWYTSSGTMDGLAQKLAGVPITCVHANDARADRTAKEQIDNQRSLPMENGVIDFRAIAKVLRDVRYDGPVFVEPFEPWTKRFAQMGTDAACKHIADLMLPLLRA